MVTASKNAFPQFQGQEIPDCVLAVKACNAAQRMSAFLEMVRRSTFDRDAYAFASLVDLH